MKRGSGRAAAPPGLKKFQGNRKLLKILHNEIYFSTVKNSKATLFFRASASCSKILNIKIYIQYSKFREPSVFQGNRKLFKNSECKKYSQYSEKFQGNSVFRASAGYSKFLNYEKYIFSIIKKNIYIYSVKKIYSEL